jgi:hypothetical protein
MEIARRAVGARSVATHEAELVNKEDRVFRAKVVRACVVESVLRNLTGANLSD